MNLYLFNDTDYAATYGIGAYVKELTHALENSGINIHIVHLHSVCPEFVITTTNHIENWYIPEVVGHNTFSGLVYELEDYCRNVVCLLRQYIKDTKDLIFHFNYNQYQFLAKELKAVFDCKTVTTIHFTKWAIEYQGNLYRLQSLKAKTENQRSEYEQLLYDTDEYEGLQYKAVDRVITLSAYMRMILCIEYQINPDKASVIPNGLADLKPQLNTNRDTLRKKWCLTDKEFLILFAGRLYSAKGISFLIQAFRKVLEKIPDCRLMFAGNGLFEQYIQEAKDICTKVTFTGLLGKEELHELYQIADIGVLPSLTEQCSYVVIEMLMYGLPLITTSAPGLAEMTVDGISGLQVPLITNPESVGMDTDLLAEKILYLLENPEFAGQLGKNARKRYEELYTIELFCKNMIDLFRSLYFNDMDCFASLPMT